MNFFEKLQNKENLRKDFLLVSFFVTLYENFKSNWEEEILAFYANSIRVKDDKPVFEFTQINHNNPKAFEECDFINNNDAENKYKTEVYRQVKKANGKEYDKAASMFMWLLKHELIKDEHYKQLLCIKSLRNKLVHELDELLNVEFPDDLNLRIKQLIDIRKYSSREWFINVELALNGEMEFDVNSNIEIPDEVYASSDIFYDLLYDALFND